MKWQRASETNMSKSLTPGTWCRPSSEKEWRLILDLAEELGVGGHDYFREYDREYTLVGVTDHGSVVGVWSMIPSSDSQFWNTELPVPEFIAGMYELAKEKKVVEVNGPAKKYYSLASHEERIRALEKLPALVEYHNRQVDRLDSHMIEAETRLGGIDDRIEKLEAALNDHLAKERGSGADEFTRLQNETLVLLRDGGKQVRCKLGGKIWQFVAHKNGVTTLPMLHNDFPVIMLE